MVSIIESLNLKQKSLPLTLELMIDLIDLEYSADDIPTVTRLREGINEVFDVEFTEDEILFSELSSLEEEDMRLQYKHLNIVMP